MCIFRFIILVIHYVILWCIIFYSCQKNNNLNASNIAGNANITSQKLLSKFCVNGNANAVAYAVVIPTENNILYTPIKFPFISDDSISLIYTKVEAALIPYAIPSINHYKKYKNFLKMLEQIQI